MILNTWALPTNPGIMDSAIIDRYPRVHQLEDGAKVTCSLMRSDALRLQATT